MTKRRSLPPALVMAVVIAVYAFQTWPRYFSRAPSRTPGTWPFG